MDTRHTRAIIDTQAIAHNLRAIAAHVGTAKAMAVVKADGYGHGLQAAGRAALSGGACALAVATVEEGVALREGGLTCDVLLMGPLTPEGALESVRHSLVASLYDGAELAYLTEAAKGLNRPVRAHLRVDTGMHRLGVEPEGAAAFLDSVEEHPQIHLEGVYSHFVDADDAGFSMEQIARFEAALAVVMPRYPALVRHMAASGGALSIPASRYDMVRCGIAVYGYPSCESDIALRPAASVLSQVVQVRRVSAGESVSYGREFFAGCDSLIATLPVGYGDGYSRCFGNRAQVLIRGQKASVVGRVCMDMCMADVTDIPGVSIGDEVVLMGERAAERVTAQDWADWRGTAIHEALCGLTARMPREVI